MGRSGLSFSFGFGSNVTFSVTAAGAPPLTYQWRLNGALLFGANDSNYTSA
jgi:hypothetical protein